MTNLPIGGIMVNHRMKMLEKNGLRNINSNLLRNLDNKLMDLGETNETP